VKCSEVKVLGTGCLSLLQDNRQYEVLLLLSYYFGSIVCHFIDGCVFCVLLFKLVYCAFLLLCMFPSSYCVSLCCSVSCLCVNVYCTTAPGVKPNYSYQIYRIIS